MTNEYSNFAALVQDDLIALEDGFFYFEPKGTGVLSAHSLRMIADLLDQINAPWEREIEEYFLSALVVSA